MYRLIWIGLFDTWKRNCLRLEISVKETWFSVGYYLLNTFKGRQRLIGQETSPVILPSQLQGVSSLSFAAAFHEKLLINFVSYSNSEVIAGKFSFVNMCMLISCALQVVHEFLTTTSNKINCLLFKRQNWLPKKSTFQKHIVALVKWVFVCVHPVVANISLSHVFSGVLSGRVIELEWLVQTCMLKTYLEPWLDSLYLCIMPEEFIRAFKF